RIPGPGRKGVAGGRQPLVVRLPAQRAANPRRTTQARAADGATLSLPVGAATDGGPEFRLPSAAMQLNRFDLNLLIALDALLHEKNVTRAAERVFVSQPAMSAALQKLRDYFDDPLLVRVGRDMELTPRGLSLVEPVREALLRIQATLGTQPTFDPATVKRTFTVIVTDEAAGGVVPAALRRVAREAPGVQCHIEQVSQTSLGRIEYGDADLCLCLDILRLFGL